MSCNTFISLNIGILPGITKTINVSTKIIFTSFVLRPTLMVYSVNFIHTSKNRVHLSLYNTSKVLDHWIWWHDQHRNLKEVKIACYNWNGEVRSKLGYFIFCAMHNLRLLKVSFVSMLNYYIHVQWVSNINFIFTVVF